MNNCGAGQAKSSMGLPPAKVGGGPQKFRPGAEPIIICNFGPRGRGHPYIIGEVINEQGHMLDYLIPSYTKSCPTIDQLLAIHEPTIIQPNTNQH